MAKFIELTFPSGEKFLMNINSIESIQVDDEGSTLIYTRFGENPYCVLERYYYLKDTLKVSANVFDSTIDPLVTDFCKP